MKKYRLLKDLPGCPRGSESISHQEAEAIDLQVDMCQSEAIFFVRFGDSVYAYSEHIVKSMPDWFEPVEEPQFTRSDMIEFAMHGAGSLRTRGYVEYTDLLDSWLKTRNNE